MSQIQILSGTVSSLNKLLVDRGIVSEYELQDYFQKWMKENSSEKFFKDMSLDEVFDLETKHTAFIGHGTSSAQPKKKQKK
ncbi:MAG: hypothetical protein AAB556_01695 [Patescibacteria group bacterium]